MATPDPPEPRPFLTEARPEGQAQGGAAPDALFDLAVNRAWAAQRGVGGSGGLGHPDVLAAWHARTRFARRVPLAEVRRALALHPATAGPWHWAGGPQGGWLPGKAPFP